MPDATFDGVNLIIQLPNVGTFDIERDIYSAWKEWVATGDNAKYLQAFDTIGGDDIGDNQAVAPYVFLRNDLGWRVRAAYVNGETVLRGNLFPRDPQTSAFLTTPGFDVFIRQETSTRAVVVTVPTGSGVTAQDKVDIISGVNDEQARYWKADEYKTSATYQRRDKDTNEVLVDKSYSNDGNGNETLIET